MIDSHRLDDLVDGLEPPSPPTELRNRALASARAALAGARTTPGLWTRLWFNTSLRLAWAATVAVLLIAHAVLSLRSSAPTLDGHGGASNRVVSATYNAELAEITDLPRVGADPYAALDSERSKGNDV